MSDAPAPTPVDVWPFDGLRVAWGDLELRFMDDALLHAVALVAAEGIHAPEARPFLHPWSVGDPAAVARSVLQYQWGARSRITAASWVLELGVVHDGVPVGIQGLYADAFAVTRQASSGSWLGRRFHGHGLGTRARLMILHLAFEGFGARQVGTSAWADNAPSLGVTRKVGYEPNGQGYLEREGAAVLDVRFRIERDAWDARPEALRRALDEHGPIELHGLGPVRTYLGLDDGPEHETTTDQDETKD